MDEKKVEGLITDLNNPEENKKLSALDALINLAKTAENISPALISLESFLLHKNKDYRQKAAKAIKYYYQNYVSFYCRNFGGFFSTLEKLESPRKKDRKDAFHNLNNYPKFRDPRKWTYPKDSEKKSLNENLNSLDPIIKIGALNSLDNLIEKNMEISDFYKQLISFLTDENEEVRWRSAHILEKFIGNYTQTGYYYTHQFINKLEQQDKLSYALNMASAARYDMISDRDERDISYALPKLALLLLDEDKKVRKAATEAIRTAQGEHELNIIIPIIIKVLKDFSKASIHREVAQILRAEIESGLDLSNYIEGLSTIFEIPNVEKTQKELVLIIRKAVEEGYDLKNLLPLFESLLNNDYDEIKFGAADTLAYYYTLQEDWKNIKRLLTHRDKDVRQEAVGTIEYIKKITDLKPILPDIIKLLRDEEIEVRFVAARTLLKKYDSIQNLHTVIPIMASFAKDSNAKLRNNALNLIISWIKDNITCRSKIKPSEYDKIEPFIIILEDRLKKKGKTEVAEPLTQLYTHSGQLEKIKDLLLSSTVKMKKDVLFRLTTCGWSDCKVDVSGLIPTIIELHFTQKNKELKDYCIRKLEDIVNNKKARQIIKDIKKYPINERWKLEEKLRTISISNERRKIMKQTESLSENQKFEFVMKLLKDDDSMIQTYASHELWNFYYLEDKQYITIAISSLTENLNSSDPYLKSISASLLYGAAIQKIDISQAINSLVKLLSEEADNVRSKAASSLSSAAEMGVDISIAIPELIKNIKHENHEVSYFSTSATRYFVKSKKDAEFVVKQLDKEKVNRNKNELKRLLEKCEKFLE